MHFILNSRIIILILISEYYLKYFRIKEYVIPLHPHILLPIFLENAFLPVSKNPFFTQIKNYDSCCHVAHFPLQLFHLNLSWLSTMAAN